MKQGHELALVVEFLMRCQGNVFEGVTFEQRRERLEGDSHAAFWGRQEHSRLSLVISHFSSLLLESFFLMSCVFSENNICIKSFKLICMKLSIEFSYD